MRSLDIFSGSTAQETLSPPNYALSSNANLRTCVKVTNEPELLRRMYGVRSLYRRNKGHVAYQFKPGHDNIISVMDDGKHTRLRSKMFAGVSSTIRSRASLTVCSIQEKRMTIS